MHLKFKASHNTCGVKSLKKRKREQDTVPEIYMNGTDTDTLPAYEYPVCGELPSTVITVSAIGLYAAVIGDARPEV